MKGVSRKAVPYVLEDDRALPVEEQTIWHLLPKNTQAANETLRRYARASKEGRNGQREYDARALTAADIEEFQADCIKVENFCFSAEYLERHPQMADRCSEEGYCREVTDPQTMQEIVLELAPEHLRELLAVVDNPVKLSAGAKKG